jgi:hypothetical protein
MPRTKRASEVKRERRYYMPILQARIGYLEQMIEPGTPEHQRLLEISPTADKDSRFISRITVNPPCDRCQSNPSEGFISFHEGESLNETRFQLCPACMRAFYADDVEEEINKIIHRWAKQTGLIA